MIDFEETLFVLKEEIHNYFDPYFTDSARNFAAYYEERDTNEWWEEDEMLDKACNDLADYLAQFLCKEGERYYTEMARRYDAIQEVYEIVKDKVDNFRNNEQIPGTKRIV